MHLSNALLFSKGEPIVLTPREHSREHRVRTHRATLGTHYPRNRNLNLTTLLFILLDKHGIGALTGGCPGELKASLYASEPPYLANL